MKEIVHVGQTLHIFTKLPIHVWKSMIDWMEGLQGAWVESG